MKSTGLDDQQYTAAPVNIKEFFCTNEKLAILLKFVQNPRNIITDDNYPLDQALTKFLIFTQFADTAHYLLANLDNALLITGTIAKKNRLTDLGKFQAR